MSSTTKNLSNPSLNKKKIEIFLTNNWTALRFDLKHSPCQKYWNISIFAHHSRVWVVPHIPQCDIYLTKFQIYDHAHIKTILYALINFARIQNWPSGSISLSYQRAIISIMRHESIISILNCNYRGKAAHY